MPPRLISDAGFTSYEELLRGQIADADRHAARLGATLVLIGILPTVTPDHTVLANISANPRYSLLNTADPGRPRRRHHHRYPRPGTATGAHRVDPAGGGEHEHPVPHPGRARDVRELLECRPGDRRCRGGRRRQFSVSLRPSAVGGDPGAAVRAGDRHPAGRAEESRRAVPSLVRGAVDHVDLRPVRGERAVLPGTASHLRGGGSRRGARRRRGATARPSYACTTARSTAGTGRSTTSGTVVRTCGWRTASCPPGPRSSTCWPTPRSTSD